MENTRESVGIKFWKIDGRGKSVPSEETWPESALLMIPNEHTVILLGLSLVRLECSVKRVGVDRRERDV